MEFLHFITGLGLFLFGMAQLEDGLRLLAGRGFRSFIRHQTRSPLRGIVVGIISTAALQSSSVVTLMVIALAGAGILQVRHALGVVIGSNLGTTFTGWIVATLGFKLDFALAAQALVATGGVIFTLSPRGSRRRNAARIALGLGLLLLGLDGMKEAMAGFSRQFDVSPFAGLPFPVLTLIGFGVTAIIQSSSAAMMIALGALDAGMVSLPHAAAFVIGADLGTTLTGVIGSLGEGAEKKRVAFAHVLFNLITDIVALILLPLLLAVLARTGFSDPLFTLVAFHSSFNLIGILLFLPALGPFARFLERRFAVEESAAWAPLRGVPVEETDTALEMLGGASKEALRRALSLVGEAVTPPSGPTVMGHDPWMKRYADLKRMEGEMLDFAARLQGQSLELPGADQVQHALSVVREAVIAAKAFQDLRGDLRHFRDPGFKGALEEWQRFEAHLHPWLEQLTPLLEPQASSAAVATDLLSTLQRQAVEFHDETHRHLLEHAARDSLSEEQLSTLLNVNREVRVAGRALIDALAWTVLGPAARGFEAALPW